LTIDGKEIEASEGSSVLETALAHGIDIPRLCYHPDLSISGGCRLCLVEVEGRDLPAPSCGLSCEDGMVVQTQSELLDQLRRDVIDVFLAEHPHWIVSLAIRRALAICRTLPTNMDLKAPAMT
jgi:NADH dehydrogenase/NADH:ubiquinone oxidoreductase subunit G